MIKTQLIKLLKHIDLALIKAETVTRALRTKLVWYRWDLEDYLGYEEEYDDEG